VKTFEDLLMNQWPKCINIWHVTSFGHSLIKKHIWQKLGDRYRPTGPLVDIR